MEFDFQEFIGKSVGPQKIEYTWRDVALYALAVGADENDLMYTYEQNMKTLPSFGVIPCWNAINTRPQRPTPFPAPAIIMNEYVRRAGEFPGGLDMEHELIIHRPIDPIKGSLIFEDTITEVYDRGEGKGVVTKSSMPVYDEAGNLLCENVAHHLFFAGGGFGGKQPPKSDVVIPDREPDNIVADHVSKTQNVLYRLTGDTNHIHVSPEFAKASGYPKPFMQGLCSFGFACRMAIKAAIPGEPERMKRIAAQMRNICWPDSDVELHGWKDGENRIVFRLVNVADGKAILDRGVFEWK